jgi:hypothetical protein
MANDQINVPSLVVILVLSGLIVRYLFFSPPASERQAGAGRGRDSSLAAMRQREAAAERITQMFPQVDRRAALWDLQRNGGNIAATTERILSGRMETVRASALHCHVLLAGWTQDTDVLANSLRSHSSRPRRQVPTRRHHHRRSPPARDPRRSRRSRT